MCLLLDRLFNHKLNGGSGLNVTRVTKCMLIGWACGSTTKMCMKMPSIHAVSVIFRQSIKYILQGIFIQAMVVSSLFAIFVSFLQQQKVILKSI